MTNIIRLLFLLILNKYKFVSELILEEGNIDSIYTNDFTDIVVSSLEFISISIFVFFKPAGHNAGFFIV